MIVSLLEKDNCRNIGHLTNDEVNFSGVKLDFFSDSGAGLPVIAEILDCYKYKKIEVKCYTNFYET